MTKRDEDMTEDLLDLHKQLAEKVQGMNDSLHKLCGQVHEIREGQLAMIAQLVGMSDRISTMRLRTLFLAAMVSLGGGIIAAVVTAWTWLAARLDSILGVRP